MRASGTPSCRMVTTAAMAPPSVSKGQTAAAMVSGTPNTRN